MYNAKYIIPGVLIAVVAFTSPFWLNLGGKTYVYPEVALPTGEGKDKCIESKEWMRAEHMALLNTWRDEAIREGKREYVATDGRKWVISLQDTCMACHTNKADFCDKCHNSNNVDRIAGPATSRRGGTTNEKQKRLSEDSRSLRLCAGHGFRPDPRNREQGQRPPGGHRARQGQLHQRT